MSKVLLGLLLLVTLATHAEVSQFEKEVFPQVRVSEGIRQDSYLRVFKRALPLLNDLPITQSEAEKIVYLSGEIKEEPAYLPLDKRLQLGGLPECRQNTRIDPLAFNLHELAHSVYAPNLREAFNLGNEINIGEHFNPQNAIANRSDEFKKRVPIQDLSKPFDEVFADTFAVLATGNPQAISSQLDFCQRPNFRNFLKRYDVKGWKEGTLKPFFLSLNSNYYSAKTDKLIFVDAQVHEVLSPWRSVIWQTYLKLKTSGQKDAKERLIKAVFDTSMEMIRQLHTSQITYGEWFEISKPELNQKTIDLFLKFAIENQK